MGILRPCPTWAALHRKVDSVTCAKPPVRTDSLPRTRVLNCQRRMFRCYPLNPQWISPCAAHCQITMSPPPSSATQPRKMRPLPTVIFASRWLQLPLYLGLIVAQMVYVFHFWVELVHLIEAAFGSADAVRIIAASVQPCDANVASAANKVCGHPRPNSPKHSSCCWCWA